MAEMKYNQELDTQFSQWWVCLAGIVTGIALSALIGYLTANLMLGVVLLGPLGIGMSLVFERVVFGKQPRQRHYF